MILILGASGRIGRYLFNRFKQDGTEVMGTHFRNKEAGTIFFDLETMPLDDLKLGAKPSHIVIAAALNPRPELSRNLNDSRKANVLQTIKLIDFCFKNGITPVYISSDNVFNGRKGDYRETDKTSPLNNYGRMKCEVENFLFASSKPYALLRMGKVLGVDDTLIMEIFKNLKQDKPVKYSMDQVFTPVYAEDVYEFVRDIAFNNYKGVFHLGSLKPLTRYEVALRIKDYFKLESEKILPCKINELGLKEKRPLKISLNIEKYKSLSGKKEKEPEHFFEKLITDKIIDPRQWERNQQGNSLAYFARTKQASVNKEMIDELLRRSKKTGNGNARFCLHSGPNENLQDMVVLVYRDKACRRLHQHRTGNEAVHVIQGRVRALVFDQQGCLIDKRILESEGESIYRNNSGTYHIYFPVTEYAILREIRDGRNEPGETVPADWDWVSIIKQHLSPEDWECGNSFCKTPCPLHRAHVKK